MARNERGGTLSRYALLWVVAALTVTMASLDGWRGLVAALLLWGVFTVAVGAGVAAHWVTHPGRRRG